MKLVVLCAMLAAASAAPARADTPPASSTPLSEAPGARPGPVDKPRWIQLPTNSDLAWFYPGRAVEGGRSGLTAIPGAARIACTVTPEGTVANCSVTEEKPAGYGFGDAALQVSKYFRMALTDQDGRPVAGRRCNLIITFSVVR